jgi:hypothetical protein
VKRTEAFFNWLAVQVDRDDLIGDLAKDFVRESRGRQMRGEAPYIRAAIFWLDVSSGDAASAFVEAVVEFLDGEA